MRAVATRKGHKSGSANVARRSAASTQRLDLLFDALREGDQAFVSAQTLQSVLAAAGLRLDDARLATMRGRIEADRAARSGADLRMDRATFEDVMQGSVSLVERVVRRELAIPDFMSFVQTVTDTFEASRAVDGGVVASYIPQLARVDPAKYGLGACTVDGQRLALGDAHDHFCLQSSCKPINYCLALEDSGAETVHQHVGFEPSGQSFNELSLNRSGRPHNPMINAGAIMSCSLIGRSLEPADRFDHVTRLWTRLTGGARPGFGNAVFLSEQRTADRNYALGYFMRENGAFPSGTDLKETLEFYFQCCSLELSADDFAVVAATLANDGVCPLTEERVLAPDTVRKCLSLMQSCGMYDYSGEWAFTVGLPAKSSVSGVIIVVIPGTLGMCVWSPRLDSIGNSQRGVAFYRDLASRCSFHPFDVPTGSEKMGDSQAVVDSGALLGELLWAASKDDVHGLRRAAAHGQALGAADYDGRTALHVAASEGRVEAIRYLLARGVDLEPVDRWGGRPVDDAKRGGHADACELLEAAAREMEKAQRSRASAPRS